MGHQSRRLSALPLGRAQRAKLLREHYQLDGVAWLHDQLRTLVTSATAGEPEQQPRTTEAIHDAYHNARIKAVP